MKDPRLEALRRLAKRDRLRVKTPFFPDRRDRAFYHELVRGVIRHRLLLDWYIQPHSKRFLGDLDAMVLDALRLGVYQILWLQMPPHAAVSETVEVLGKAGKPSAKAYVNAVLRNFLRGEMKTPDPNDLGLCYSFPQGLLDHLHEAFGWSETDEREWPDLLNALNSPLPICVRVNARKRSRDELLRIWRATDAEATIEPTVRSPVGILLKGQEDLTLLPGYSEGEFVVQSESSQLISYLLSPFDPNMRILDACAAPGGKTTHLAELTDDQSEIIALAPHRRDAVNHQEEDSSLLRLKENIKRLNLKSINLVETTAEAFAATQKPESFDRILVDAPCTGLGTLAKHPERKWLFKQSYAHKLRLQQESILKSVLPLLKKDGILLYSICSISLPEWQSAQLGTTFGNTQAEMSLPKGIDWSGIYQDKKQCFIFWPHRIHSEGLFAMRMPSRRV